MRLRLRRKKEVPQEVEHLWKCTRDCFHNGARFRKGTVYGMKASDLPHGHEGNIRHFRIEPTRKVYDFLQKEKVANAKAVFYLLK